MLLGPGHDSLHGVVQPVLGQSELIRHRGRGGVDDTLRLEHRVDVLRDPPRRVSKRHRCAADDEDLAANALAG
jgi:hypothetical protein